MRRSRMISAAVGTALLVSSTATIAASTPPAAAQTAQAAPSAWMTLSMMNASGTVGLGDTAVQPGPPEGAPPPDAYNYGGIPTPVIAFWVITVAAMIYIATRHSSGHFHITVPNSPG
jgi:hypothetical protein